MTGQDECGRLRQRALAAEAVEASLRAENARLAGLLHAVEAMDEEQLLEWHLRRALERSRGNKTAVAAMLGVSLKTVYNRIGAMAERGLRLEGTPA
jgi:transcriptional regulator with PAS, ATPase and Fis domain